MSDNDTANFVLVPWRLTPEMAKIHGFPRDRIVWFLLDAVPELVVRTEHSDMYKIPEGYAAMAWMPDRDEFLALLTECGVPIDGMKSKIFERLHPPPTYEGK